MKKETPRCKPAARRRVLRCSVAVAGVELAANFPRLVLGGVHVDVRAAIPNCKHQFGELARVNSLPAGPNHVCGCDGPGDRSACQRTRRRIGRGRWRSEVAAEPYADPAARTTPSEVNVRLSRVGLEIAVGQYKIDSAFIMTYRRIERSRRGSRDRRRSRFLEAGQARADTDSVLCVCDRERAERQDCQDNCCLKLHIPSSGSKRLTTWVD